MIRHVETPENAVLVLTNSKGRVLFAATKNDDGSYSYRGDGSGGWGYEADILRAARYIKMDAPSAKASGELAHLLT